MIVVEAHAFVSRKVARKLRAVDDLSAAAIASELQSLPTLEATSRLTPVRDLPTGYRALTLPSGYFVLYRRLTPVEIKDVSGDYADRDAYLVADLVRLVTEPEPEADDVPTEIVTVPE
jgi:hypothetical protein